MVMLQSVQHHTGLTHPVNFLTSGQSLAPECHSVQKINRMA